MWNTIFMVLLCYSIQFNPVQSELDITFLDTEASFNSEYIRDFETYVNDDNAGIFINFTLIKRLPDSTRALYKLLGASMGEYVIRTGFNVDIEFCTAFEPNYRALGDQIELIGIDGDNCPPNPGIYGSDNFILSFNNLPDTFPPNNYLAILKCYTEKEQILEFKLFLRLAV